jgi:hypothetical protein
MRRYTETERATIRKMAIAASSMMFHYSEDPALFISACEFMIVCARVTLERIQE